jgi:hypothetical protein
VSTKITAHLTEGVSYGYQVMISHASMDATIATAWQRLLRRVFPESNLRYSSDRRDYAFGGYSGPQYEGVAKSDVHKVVRDIAGGAKVLYPEEDSEAACLEYGDVLRKNTYLFQSEHIQYEKRISTGA